MKKIFFLVIAAALTGCFASRDGIQASLVDAELVKVDTVERYSNDYQQILTWRTSDNMEYISYVPLSRRFTKGTRMTVLVRQ